MGMIKIIGTVVFLAMLGLIAWLKFAIAQAEQDNFNNISVVINMYENERMATKRLIRPSVESCLSAYGEGIPPEPIVDYFTSFSKFAYRNIEGSASNWMAAMGPFVEKEIPRMSQALSELPEEQIIAAEPFAKLIARDSIKLLGCVSTGIVQRTNL